MNISYNWLKDYLKINLSPTEISKILTDLGLEVEGYEEIESIKGGLKGLVVGEVLTCQKHPNADKLSVTTVNIGGETPLHVVCGAPNVAAGQKVIVATIGTVLYSGTESFTIKQSKIRGELSEGMICAEDEIGLGKSHDGIMVLPAEAVVGTPAATYFNIESDIVFEIGLTPNRVDSASHYGVARDLAAYLNQHQPIQLQKPNVSAFKVDKAENKITVKVENHEAAPRYTGVAISNVTVAESPEWLKNRLKAIGVNPINNIVDITNYVLHDLGQPLHAFDADKITGNTVVVKTLAEGTPFVTLDNIERKLNENDLMICNANGGMCMAGVFGGAASGVGNDTRNIFLESAYFNPVSVRKTAKRHGLSTDSSFRFERGTDPNMPLTALKRAALLIKEIARGTISSDIIDIYPNPVADFVVELQLSYIEKLLGVKIPTETIKKILTSLEIKIAQENNTTLLLNIPPYRVDVQRPADIAEEILRVYGFNAIPVDNNLKSTLTYTQKPNQEKLKNTISDILVANGFNEMMSNSLTKASYYEGIEAYKETTVKILNPLSNDLSVMRQSLIFGGLEAVSHNVNRQANALRLFEFGNIYAINPKVKSDNPHHKYFEEEHLALFINGKKGEPNWLQPEQPSSFFQLKGFVHLILERLGFEVNDLALVEIEHPFYDEAVAYQHQGKTIVQFGFVAESAKQSFKLSSPLFAADFNWSLCLKKIAKHTVLFKELPKYPEVSRDLSMLIDKNITFAKIKEIAQKTERKILQKVALFDVYQNEKLGKDKKSYAVNFIFRDDNKTLTDVQIDKIMSDLVKAFETELGASLR